MQCLLNFRHLEKKKLLTAGSSLYGIHTRASLRRREDELNIWNAYRESIG